MDKNAYISKLRNALGRLPRAEVAQALQYYNEIFDDAKENGKSDAEVIDGLGSPEDAAAQIIADFGQKEDGRRQAFADAKCQPNMKNYRKSLRASFAAPFIWPLKILVAFVTVIVAIAAFAVVISIGAAAVGVFVAGVAVGASAIPAGIYLGSFDYALIGAGSGLVLFGLGILLFALTAAIYKGSIRSGAFIFGAISGGRKNGQI